MLDSRLRTLACSTLLVAGCSVLNSFDELGEIKEAGGESGSGGSQAGTENGGMPGTDAGAPTTDAGQGGAPVPEGGTSSAGAPPVEVGGEGGGGPEPMALPGAIVVSGTSTSDAGAGVLSVLSPQSGKELRRDKVIVPMLAYDGPRDLWYLAGIKDGMPMVELNMRSFNRVTNEWVDAGPGITLPLPADTAASGWVALRQRFAYLTNAGGELTIIDSTDPANLVIQTKLTLSSKAAGLIGSFGNNPGGTVNIVRTNTACVADSHCEVTLARVIIKATGTLMEEAAVSVGAVPNPNGKAAWGANTVDGNDVLITPPLPSGTDMGTLVQLNPGTHAQVQGSARSFVLNSFQPRGFAYDSCTGIAFTAETVAKVGNTTIYAIPDGAGSVGTVQPPQAAQGVFFEPFTRTLIVPFSSGVNHDILAYNLTGTASSPKLTKRSVAQWSPPTDLDPDLLAVATPYPANCQ
jgi:hypothetical protein